MHLDRPLCRQSVAIQAIRPHTAAISADDTALRVLRGVSCPGKLELGIQFNWVLPVCIFRETCKIMSNYCAGSPKS